MQLHQQYFSKIWTTMWISGCMVFLFLCGLFAGGGCDGKCGSFETVTMAKIQEAKTKIFSDPQGAILLYDQLACPGPCHYQVAQFLVATQKSFNVSMIDVKLLFEQVIQHLNEILTLHNQNTDPKLAPTLTLLLDGFLASIIKAFYFLCDANQAINEAVNSAVPLMSAQTKSCYVSLTKMVHCAQDHNIHVDGQIYAQTSACMHNAMATLITTFQSFLAILDSFKSVLPQITVQIYDCLVISEPNSDLLVMLATAKCLTHVQVDGGRKTMDLVGNATVAVPELITQIQMTTINLQKCGTFYVEKYRNELTSDNNYQCSRL